ncbi:MAG: zinc-dependent peptidase [Planctomycetes bacterium]|nr:zinc-dependent peptidase [Planctomycetota bacterium]
MARSVPHYRFLSPDERKRAHDLIERFIAEKEFWGNRDLTVTQHMKLVVAAQACLLILNIPRLGLYPETKEVILYPEDFGLSLDAIGPDGRTYHIDQSRIGEASRRGPVLLAWEHVKQSASDRLDGRNVVFHEFAHALDYLNGEADGAPPLERSNDFTEWSRVMSSELRALRAAASMGRRTLLDPYGAESPAEFFAVATEHFFEDGRRMKRNHPALYAQLRAFYKQETADWAV